MSKKCTQCGKTNDDIVSFCINCKGTNFIKINTAEEELNNEMAKNHLNNQAKLFMLSITDKISNNKVLIVRSELSKLSADEIAMLSTIDFKNQTTAAILEFLWFGLGRIYIGDYTLGIILCIVDFFMVCIYFASFGIGFILGVPLWIILVTSVVSATKEVNYKKLIKIIKGLNC